MEEVDSVYYNYRINIIIMFDKEKYKSFHNLVLQGYFDAIYLGEV